MKRLTLGLAVVLLVPLSTQAQDSTTKESTTKVEKSAFARLNDEYQKSYQDILAKFRAAKTEEEKGKVREQFTKMGKDFLPKFLAGAKEAPASDSGFSCLAWVLQRRPTGKVFEEALDMLSKHHVTHKNVSQVTSALMSSKNEKAKKFLESVLNHHPDNSVRGGITFQFAENMKSTAERAGDLQMYAKAEKAYEKVTTDFGDVRYARGGTLAKASKAALDEMRGPRALGKITPEIEAEDLDGETFKISDYRGKVVLIDFWGNW